MREGEGQKAYSDGARVAVGLEAKVGGGGVGENCVKACSMRRTRRPLSKGEGSLQAA